MFERIAEQYELFERRAELSFTMLEQALSGLILHLFLHELVKSKQGI